MEEKRKKEEERELKQAKFNAQDSIESLLNNPDIPKSVKNLLSKIKI